jgi:hypothetical protein
LSTGCGNAELEIQAFDSLFDRSYHYIGVDLYDLYRIENNKLARKDVRFAMIDAGLPERFRETGFARDKYVLLFINKCHIDPYKRAIYSVNLESSSVQDPDLIKQLSCSMGRVVDQTDKTIEIALNPDIAGLLNAWLKQEVFAQAREMPTSSNAEFKNLLKIVTKRDWSMNLTKKSAWCEMATDSNANDMVQLLQSYGIDASVRTTTAKQTLVMIDNFESGELVLLLEWAT